MSNYELKKLTNELYWRCCNMGEKEDNVYENLMACLRYAKANGADALINEKDDTKIWEYILEEMTIQKYGNTF